MPYFLRSYLAAAQIMDGLWRGDLTIIDVARDGSWINPADTRRFWSSYSTASEREATIAEIFVILSIRAARLFVNIAEFLIAYDASP